MITPSPQLSLPSIPQDIETSLKKQIEKIDIDEVMDTADSIREYFRDPEKFDLYKEEICSMWWKLRNPGSEGSFKNQESKTKNYYQVKFHRLKKKIFHEYTQAETECLMELQECQTIIMEGINNKLNTDTITKSVMKLMSENKNQAKKFMQV